MEKVCQIIHSIKFYALVIFLLITALPCGIAQAKISGIVINQKKLPMPYSNVFIKGTYEGTVTNDSGRFTLYTTQTGNIILGASFLGMQTSFKEINSNDSCQNIQLILIEDNTSLTEVVITAGTFVASDQNKAELLKPRDIGTTAGTPGDIQSTIEKLPSTQKIGYTEGLFVRGGSDKESNYIMDGLVLPNPYYAHVPGLKQMTREDPFLFSGTIFSAGGYSAEYGQALSSILILNSKGIADSTLTGGGIHLYGGTAFHTQRWQNTSLYINLNYNDLSPYYHAFKFITENVAWTKPPQNKDIKIVFRNKPNNNGLFKLYADISTTQEGIAYNDSQKIAQSNFNIKNYYYVVNSNYTQYFNDDKTSLYAGVSASNNSDKYNYGGINLNESENVYQGKVMAKHEFTNKLKLKSGGDIIDKRLQGSMDEKKSDVNIYLVSFFVESEATIRKKFALRIGVRMEQASYSNSNTMAPRSSFAYKLAKNSQVSFSHGIFYQLPDKEIILVNPSGLGNQRAEHYIANYQFQKNDRTLRVELYYKNYYNLVTDYKPQQNYLGHAGFAKGVELFFRDKTTIPNLDYWISYSYVQSKRKTIIPESYITPDYVSANTLSIVNKYWIPSIGIVLSTSYSYASQRNYNYLNQNGMATQLVIPAYSSFDISVSKPLMLFHKQSIIFCSLQNVFGYDKVLGYLPIPMFAEPFHVYPTEKRSPFIGIFLSMYLN